MKNIYNFVYCIDNTDDFLLDSKQLNEQETIVDKLFDSVELSPSKTAIEAILDFAKII